MPYTFSELRVGCSGFFRKTITDADINMFVAVSGDTNPLHIDDVFAETTIFKKRIAHGMISAGLISSAIAQTLPGAIYMGQTLSFLAPVFVGDTIKAVVTCTEIGEKNRVKLKTECLNQNGVLVTKGEALVKLPDPAENTDGLESWQTDYADRAFAARETGKGLYPVSVLHPGCTIKQAYEIQALNVAREKRKGRKHSGYKVGLTTAAGQEKFKIEQPMYGCLFSDMHWENGSGIDYSKLNSPLMELEVYFTLSRDVDSVLYTVGDAAECIEKAGIAFEVVSGRLSTPAENAADLIADNALARGIVLGGGTEDRDRFYELPEAEFSLFKNGAELQRAKGSDILGHPLRSLIWLSNTLLASGRYLKKGDVVMAGSATAAVPIREGDRFAAECEGLGRVSVQF